MMVIEAIKVDEIDKGEYKKWRKEVKISKTSQKKKQKNSQIEDFARGELVKEMQEQPQRSR